MGLSRPARIKILLAIDTAFFFVELIVGMFAPTRKLLSLTRRRVCRWLTGPRRR